LGQVSNLDLISKRLEGFAHDLPSEPSSLYDPIAYTLGLGGKRVRPMLTLLGCELFGCPANQAIDIAAAVEVFHNFSLIHDDIMDQAPIRRGRPTVYKAWNTNIAILSGDATLVKAYQLIVNSQLPEFAKVKVLEVFNRVALDVCEGQQFDMDFESNSEISIAQYLKMIELKTAVLLGGALQMGAIVAGAADKDAQLIYDFGRNLGLAFQLQDDLLDVFSTNEKFGKQVGGDIKSNKKTFLLLQALTLAKKRPEIDQKLQQALLLPSENNEVKVQIIKDLYVELGLESLAKSEIDKYFRIATSSLEQITVSDEKKQFILQFIDQLIARET